MLQINDIGFEHYIYELNSKSINEETISKVIKHTIDSLFSLEGKFFNYLNRITKKRHWI